MPSKPVFVSSLLAFLFLVTALLYKRHLDTAADEHLKSVLEGLLKAENAVRQTNDLRVAVGFGSCVDVIGPGLDILEKIRAEVPSVPEHFDTVHNKEELEKIFAYFFRHGAAAE